MELLDPSIELVTTHRKLSSG